MKKLSFVLLSGTFVLLAITFLLLGLTKTDAAGLSDPRFTIRLNWAYDYYGDGTRYETGLGMATFPTAKTVKVYASEANFQSLSYTRVVSPDNSPPITLASGTGPNRIVEIGITEQGSPTGFFSSKWNVSDCLPGPEITWSVGTDGIYMIIRNGLRDKELLASFNDGKTWSTIFAKNLLDAYSVERTGQVYLSTTRSPNPNAMNTCSYLHWNLNEFQIPGEPTPTATPTNTPIATPTNTPTAGPTTKCPSVENTLKFAIVYGDVFVNGQPSPVNSIIEVKNPRGQTVGCQVSPYAQTMQLMYVYGEEVEPDGHTAVGMQNGEKMTFYVNGQLATAKPIKPEWLFWADDWSTSRRIDLSVNSGQSPAQSPLSVASVVFIPAAIKQKGW